MNETTPTTTAAQPLDLGKLAEIANRVQARGLFNASCDILDWIQEVHTAHARAAQPESATGTTGASVPTWQARITGCGVIESGCQGGGLKCGEDWYGRIYYCQNCAEKARDAEIADLRTQHAAKGQDEAFRDAVSYGTGVLQDGRHIPYADLYATPASAQPDSGAVPPASQQVAPKVSRDWLEDASHENGNYQCICSTCGNTFIGYKRRFTCKVCAAPSAVAPSDAKGKADNPQRIRNEVDWENGLTQLLEDYKHATDYGINSREAVQENIIAYVLSGHAATSAADAKDAARLVETEMADRLRRMVANRGEGPITVQSKLLLQAADECDRFYNGMMNWKANAQAKDRTIIELRDVATSAADAKDSARFRWLNEDHDDADVREKARDLAGRLGTSSYYAITRNIDAAMAAAPSSEKGGAA